MKKKQRRSQRRSNDYQGICRLDKLKPGCRGRIRRHRGKGAIRRRLLDLGLVPETTVAVICVAPLNDPILLKLETDQIALRKQEAALIEIEMLPKDSI